MIKFLKRAYTVMEVRTGFATGLPVLSSSLFGAYISGNIKVLPLILMFISGFCLNIVANIANEIRAFIKNEENSETFTGHKGSEGLVRGDAGLLDAVIMLLIMLGMAGISGLGVVALTKNLNILWIGIISALAAITYSLGPKPYIVYPVGEVVSGIFVGGISSLVAIYAQTGQISISAYLYSGISLIMTVFLMSTNNTSDYEKDKGSRTTLPHVIGFRNSIKIIIPEALLMIACWSALTVMGSVPIWVYLIGLVIFYEYGYRRWYKDYYKIQEVYPEMGREWGPRPLLLIYSFHIIMSCIFLSLTILS